MVPLRGTVRQGLRPWTPALSRRPPMLAPSRGRHRSRTRAAIAIYHANVVAFSRGKGHSATAAAAYRAGLKIADERTGLLHDYTRRRGVVSVDQLAPAGAPEWCRDPVKFWNANEVAETRANARVARELEVALPAELDADQRHALAVDLGRLLMERYQVAVLVAVHAPDRKGDERNHHCHILASARQIGPDGLGGRAMAEFDARAGAGADAIRDLRAAVAERINAHLAAAGLGERVDHRTLAAQSFAAEERGDFTAAAALTRTATIHEGKKATAARRIGRTLDRAAENDTIRADNDASLRAYLAEAEAEGRVVAPPDGHAAQAHADRAREVRTATTDPERVPAPRQAPAGPLAPVGVQGYTRMQGGKPVRVARHTRQQHTSTRATVRAERSSIARATGAGAALLNAQAEAAAATARAQVEASQRGLDMMQEAWRETQRAFQVLIEAYAKAQQLPACDVETLRQHCRRDPDCADVLRRSLDARARFLRAESRPERRRATCTQAMLATADARKAIDALDTEKPALWKPLSRREWAERRRRAAAQVEQTAHAERKALRGVEPRAMDHYAAQTAVARATWNQVEHERRQRFPISIDIAAEMKATDQALAAYFDGLRPEALDVDDLPTAHADGTPSDPAKGTRRRTGMRQR
jgi:hypothetical protein